MPTLENKIPPPLVALLFATMMWITTRYIPGAGSDSPVPTIAAVVIACAGMAICIAGAIVFRRAGTTVNPLKPEATTVLVTGGIYQYSRNPMYTGFALVLLGWAVYLQSPATLWGVAGFMLYMGRFQIAPEERALETQFGPAFADYRARVRRWL